MCLNHIRYEIFTDHYIVNFGVDNKSGIRTVKQPENERDLLALSTYPNPFQVGFYIEFDVEEDGSQVKLELVDIAGRTLKTIVENPHAKGRWKYHLGKLDAAPEIVFCRLKVNDLYTIRKLVKGN